MKIISIIFDRIPVRIIVSIFAISIFYSYFRGFEASMFIFLGSMGVLGAKFLISHVRERRNGNER